MAPPPPKPHPPLKLISLRTTDIPSFSILNIRTKLAFKEWPCPFIVMSFEILTPYTKLSVE